MNKPLLTAAALCGLLVALPAHADIMWGVAGPYTGSVAAWGTSQLAGIKQAVEDINGAGGINGQKIVIKTYDDACDPKQAVAVASKIVSENIHFALHGTCSAASLAALKTYIEEGIVVINAVASNPKITDEGGPTIFRAMYRDDMASKTLADEILKHFPQKKLAIIHDKSAYGLGIAEYVRDKLNKAGIKEILFESYDPTNHDYSVLVTRLKTFGVEAVFIGGYPVETGLITRQMREGGLNAQVLAGDLSTQDFWKITGKMGEGALFSFPHDPRKEPGAQDVLAKLEKVKVIVDGYTLYGYAAAQVLAQAITKTGGNDPAKVAAAIHNNEFNTILGTWSFDEKGDVRNIRQVMYRWHDGEYIETGE